ncbi:hypothetical protein [Streptomyces sp. SID8352]|uniref:hypothetical protein n=1 Tax=Streptomyces sp. SID8352 TaxID=2690338 RepID=UPI00136BBD6C|nr:hypothetical protein [Streptomyces sp. SID8352]MYU21264.1 hypothetical protein [Streptomyces sp. SID8352]
MRIPERDVRRFPDMSTSYDAPDGQGILVWTSTRPRVSLAHAVLMASETVWHTHGGDGYRQLHALPTSELKALRSCCLSGLEDSVFAGRA